MRWRALGIGLVLPLLVAGLGLAPGCGLSAVGTIPLPVPGDGSAEASREPDGSLVTVDGPVGFETSSPNDASVDASADVACDVDACALTVPSNTWTLIAFGTSQANACPQGFTTDDVYEDPVPTSGACTCGVCTVPQPPDCESGTITTTYDLKPSNGSCSIPGVMVSASGGACVASGGVLGSHAAITAPAPAGGACSATATAQQSAFTATSERVCKLDASTCSSAACSASIGSAFQTCLFADGDQTCPGTAPNKHSVGSNPMITCGPCSCSFTAMCTGDLNIYSSQDGSCSGSPVVTLPGDGSCNDTGNSAFGAYQWVEGPPQIACDSGSATPAARLTVPSTVCCP